jgi:transposase
MLDLSNQIFVYSTFVDMRKSINGLCILVSLWEQSFECGKAFVFLNKNRDKVKILAKENNGFVLLYKRLDDGQFRVALSSKTEVILTRQQLRYLLDGLDYVKLVPLKTPPPKHFF